MTGTYCCSKCNKVLEEIGIPPQVQFLQGYRRLFMVSSTPVPNNVEAEYPKSSISADFNGGAVIGTLRLQRPGATPLKLNVQRIFQTGTRAVADALRA